MYPILYETITAGTVPQHNGLGVLSDCISCTIEQERNGSYELEMTYPKDGIHAEELAFRRIIKAKPNPTDDAQLFRIDRIGKTMNGKFTVYAKQISYDLSGYTITSGTANNASLACALLQAAASGYTITTDKETTGAFRIYEPASVRSYFGGKQGSFLDIFGPAEIKYNNFTINFLNHAGADRGVTIRYGKNLLELSQEIDSSNLYTHVLAFYKDTEGNITQGSEVATGLTLDVKKTFILDASGDFEETPTTAQLTAKATQYKDNNNLTTPSNNIKLDFIQSEELTGRVDLCDTVTVYYEALGISRTQMKCIRTKYDVIREKYIETEFGDARTNLTDTIYQSNRAIELKPSTSDMEKAVGRATQLITGNLGGYVILHDSNGDGEPDEILIMNEPDIETATKVWRWNKNGLGYSSTGYSGTFGLAMTAEGEIVADYVTTGTMSGNRVRTGSITSQNGQLIMDLDNGTITAPAITLNGADVGATLAEIEQTSITTAYALSNSGTIIPENFPLTEPTEPTTSQPYLWSKTDYTYANGQTNTSYGVSVRGANGQNGADGAGLQILGNYNSMAELEAAHPTGSAGDAYMIGTDLAVWNTQTNSWENVGRIQGPSGADGLWLTIENDDTGANTNITYTAHLMNGLTSDVSTAYNAIFTWQLVKETGITEIASNTQTITVARDAADYGGTIRCICVAVTDEENLEDYSYVAISDYNGNIIQVLGGSNVRLIGDTAIYKPYAITAQFQVLAEEISSKVDKTEFNSLSGTVTRQGTAIQQNAEQIALKANQSTVNTLSGTVTQQGTAIEQNAQQITLKANTSTVNNQMAGKMATDMSNRQSSITINSGEIRFDSDTLIVNSSNLQITKTGQVTSNFFKAKNELDLIDGAGSTRGTLQYTQQGGSGFFLCNPAGVMTATLQARATGGGGHLEIRNNSSYTTVVCQAQANGGAVNVLNNSGGIRAGMFVSSGGDGTVNVYNANGNYTINLSGQSGTVTCVSVVQTSSRKVKENIKPMTGEEAEKILDLEPVAFDYKDKATGTDKRGFIAEDVAEIIPNLVTPETEDIPASLDYIGMIPYLVKLAQEQQKEIEALKKDIKKLKGE